jgi:hypothetical protein
MIKLIMQLVLPKQLSFLGTALAIGTTAYSIYDADRREDEMAGANAALTKAERAVRNEQAVRERKKQQRTANILSSQAQAIQLATGSGIGSDTNIAGVQADISANLDSNLAAMNASIGGANMISTARTNVANAGRPSLFSTINTTLQPAIFSNIDKMNNLFSTNTPPATVNTTTSG